MENQIQNQYRSEHIDKLIGSLSKAQGSYKPLIPNQNCPGGKFANLKAILLSCKESLSSNGLAFYQYTEILDEGSGGMLLKSIVGHESGQFISCISRIIPGKTERATGNIIEIYRRLHALMLLGIAPSENDPIAFDDNGEEQASLYLMDQIKKPQEAKKIERGVDVVSKEQYEDLMIELNDYPDITKDIQEIFGITTLADLPKSEYHPTLNKIRRIKKNMEEYERRRK